MILALIIIFLSASMAEGATYWVSTSGNDANKCFNSAGVPSNLGTQTMRQPKAGWACASSGDTVYILSGSYTPPSSATPGDVQSGSGTTKADLDDPSKVITISSYPGCPINPSNPGVCSSTQSVTFAGQIQFGYPGYEGSTTPHHIVFNGITFDDGATLAGQDGMIVIDFGAHHLRFVHTHMWNAPLNGIIIYQVAPWNGSYPSSDGNEFLYNEIGPNGRLYCDINGLQPIALPVGTGCGHSAYVNTSSNIFDGNYLHDVGEAHIHLYNDPCYAPLPISNNIVRNNIMTQSGGNTTRYGSRTEGAVVLGGGGNSMVGDKGRPCETNTPGWPIKSAWGTNNQVYNNLIYNNPGSIGVSDSCDSCLIYNNTLYNNNIYANPDEKITLQTQQFTVIRNNIIPNGSIVNEGGAFGFGPYTASNNYFASTPGFVDPTNANFRLCTGPQAPTANCTAASPALNAGFTLNSPWNVDIVGTTRPQPAGTNYDEGAYEMGAPAGPSVNISANPPTITSGQSSTLSWNTSNTTSCSAAASPTNGQWTGSKGLSGSQTITNITATTSFSLTCNGVTQSTSVTVPANAPTITISASPPTVPSGTSSTLTWTSSGADTCVSSTGPPSANSDWPEGASQPLSGTKLISSINSRTEFWLDCTNKNGTTSQNTVVDVTPGCPAANIQVVKLGMDETSGLPQDTSQNNNHITSLGSGNALAPTGGKYGGGVTYGGTAASTIADSNSLWLCRAWTWMAWIKPSSTATTYVAVLSKGSPPDNPYDLYSGADPGFCTNSGPIAGYALQTTSAYACYATAIAPSPTWTHLAATYDNSLSGGGNIKIYINGTQVTQQTGTATLDQTTGPLRIGGSEFTSPSEYFTGTIDEVKGWNYALTPAQITTEMITPINSTVPTGTPIIMKLSLTTQKFAGGTTEKIGVAP
jgi:hypothetical protein